MKKPKKVMLHPGEVTSKTDGDRHFIGGAQLARLYGVLPIDDVVTFDPGNPTHQEEWQKYHNIEMLHLYPRYDGKYSDIHAYDDYEPQEVKNPAAIALGSIKSKKKARSSKENGKKGGRPKKKQSK